MRGIDKKGRDLTCRCGKPMAIEDFSNIISLGSYSVFHAYYDYGLGQYINTASERRSIIKDQGLIEVGTEDLKGIVAAKKKQNQAAEDKAWEHSIVEELRRMEG